MKTVNDLKPISLWQSILLFGVPGLALYLGLYHCIPLLYKMGFPYIFLFPFFLWFPLISLFPVSLILYKREKRKNPNLNLKTRFRLNKLSNNDWFWVLGGILFVGVFDFVIMDPISKWMARLSLFAAPDHFPVLFHPLKDIELPLSNFLGISLSGNWLFLIIMVFLHSVALVAEEFMWRGYILPRQEKLYGKWAWLVNGLLWGYLLHFIMKWNFIAFLPSMLITPFIAQRTQNTYVSLLIHGIPNTILWFIILSGVLSTGG